MKPREAIDESGERIRHAVLEVQPYPDPLKDPKNRTPYVIVP